MYNEGFNPVFETVEERIEFVNKQPDLFPNFNDWYSDNLKRHNTMIEKMKLFIFNNYKSLTLKDWNNINIKVNKTKYGFKFNTEKVELKKHEHHSEILQKMFEKYNADVIEIEMINFVYDGDGDLSVAINSDDNWCFLSENDICDIGIHIENILKNE